MEITLDSILKRIASQLHKSKITYRVSNKEHSGVFYYIEDESLYFASNHASFDGGWPHIAKAAGTKYGWSVQSYMKGPLVDMLPYISAHKCTITLVNGDTYTIDIYKNECILEKVSGEASNYSIF